MSEDEAFDIVVVGGGGSGLAAAVEAARFGRSVVLLEKNAALGGTTLRSVGSVTATCTPHQRAAGIEDHPHWHYEDMALFAAARGLLEKDDPALRRLLVNESPDMVDWLTDMGVVFFGPMPEPPHRLPRMHNVLPHSRSFIYHLSRRAEALGARLRTGVRVVGLVQHGGRVAGVEVEDRGVRRRIEARQAVILTSGDFSSSDEMKARFLSPELAAVEGINPTSTGDGQRMVQEAGGEIVNGDVVWGPELRFVAPPAKSFIEKIPPVRPVALAMRWAMKLVPQALLRPFLMMFVTTNLAPSMRLFAKGAILVNREGRRFVDERAKDGPHTSIPLQTERLAYFIMDGRIARQFESWPNYISTAPGVAYAYLSDYRRNRTDICFQAASLVELAGKIGVPAVALRESVAEYNTAVPEGLTKLEEPPFVALGPVKSWIVFSDGGARINERFEVLDAASRPIAGLYAAGSAGQGGVLLEGHGHHLSWAFVSGRLAGRSAALGTGAAAVTAGPAAAAPLSLPAGAV